MGLLKDIIMPYAVGKKERQTQTVRSTTPSGGGGGIDEKRQSFKRGGKVKRTGLAKVHKGERVLTKRQAKRYRRSGSKR